MNWITNFVRPKLQAIVGKKYTRQFMANLSKLLSNATQKRIRTKPLCM